uniref:Uncharacterized protein n=1 Tax=Siphoviridae sp. ctrCN24 TaxID=2827953 RepID=A0A8S5SKD8_9CAUD|nr:MAG TPA: hypothetical protein [Siphoviridae sp. ctrCN24]
MHYLLNGVNASISRRSICKCIANSLREVAGDVGIHIEIIAVRQFRGQNAFQQFVLRRRNNINLVVGQNELTVSANSVVKLQHVKAHNASHKLNLAVAFAINIQTIARSAVRDNIHKSSSRTCKYRTHAAITILHSFAHLDKRLDVECASNAQSASRNGSQTSGQNIQRVAIHCGVDRCHNPHQHLADIFLACENIVHLSKDGNNAFLGGNSHIRRIAVLSKGSSFRTTTLAHKIVASCRHAELNHVASVFSTHISKQVKLRQNGLRNDCTDSRICNRKCSNNVHTKAQPLVQSCFRAKQTSRIFIRCSDYIFFLYINS